MLSDNTEKSKNPLKKAIRRRNAKTVQFSTPQATYFDASDYEYSSSDEEEDDELGELAGAHGIMTKESDELIDEPDRGDVSHIAPLNVKSASKETSTENLQNIDSDNADEERRKDVDSARTSDEIFDRQYSGPGKSRNGTIRNTDSFFKDNTVETKKITLTPNLLRDADRGPAEFRERGTSFDSIEKNLQPDKAKEDKKKKEKKGMLSGLFKRKDKKGKPADSDGSDEKVSYEKSSEEYIRGSARVSEELSPTERGGTVQPADGDRLQRSGSRGKLQKPRPGDLSPFGAQSADRSPEGTSPQPHSPVVSSNGAQQTMRLIEPDTDANRDEKLNLRLRPVDSLENAKAHNVQSSNSSKPIRVKPAQTRMELDDFDSSLDEIEQPTDMHVNSGAPQRQEVLNTGGGEIAERLSESPVQISPVDDHNGDLSQPPALVGDTSSQEENDSLGSSPSMHDISSLDANGAATSQSFPPPPTRPPPTPQAALDLAVSSPFSPSPSMTPTPSAVPGAFPSQATPDYQQKDMHAAQHDSAFQHSSIPSAPPRPVTPPFSAAHLRAFLDDPAPVRDLLLVVHDLNGVVPVGPEHPIMAGLFDQERGDLDKMGKTLDGLLGGWLESRTGKVAGVERKG
ncbi:hypothetical protein P152DRAFT_185203 [Eremomyces bilateralis CBS 781.70]|uniref:Uncharacterized protein n=1 Tax=Eremomyces bilateralis CBS 781.70 TaxID=1392243 RepID=A0A6G1GBN2_9PEZI|nr:uncharacterized protein P152DRAFT_185203 [Eremomyces bilateralis CBS 781.70]KAF1815424.1 hypothetical protein P152DRAFT_185203 [Eremomyces bilateralis CBS 781.70]